MNLGIGLAASNAARLGKAGHTIIKMTDAMNDHIIPPLARGISESGRSEERQGRHQDEFRSLVENSPDAIARYGVDCRRTYANPAFARFAGLAPGSLLGKRPTEHSDAPTTVEYEARIREVIATGLGCELEYCWPDYDGRLVASHVRLTPEFDADGLVTSALTVGRDISAQKESERQLERFESLAHVGHWQWDFRRRESLVSAEVCRIFGQPHDWRPHFDEVLAMIVEEDRGRILAMFRDAIAQQIPEISYSYRITNLKGEAVHLHTQVGYPDFPVDDTSVCCKAALHRCHSRSPQGCRGRSALEANLQAVDLQP